MVEALLNGFINFIFWFFGLIGNLIFNPILWLFQSLTPDLSNWLDIVLNFFNNNIFPTICWIKLSFLNIIKMPGSFWSFIVLEITTAFLIAPAFRTIRLILNIWRIAKGNKTEN